MAETSNLVLEHLRAMHGDMGKMADAMRTVGAEMTARRQHSSSLITLRKHDHLDLAPIKVRLDRIEKQLELTE
ncbi:hypothetical protein [Lichenifustis flavocetrariae]|uniref:Uncharacterized protein n=1 Tax=Lichenifustis flavocetrariae TaxID=2949735 RepID=A0AA42CJQ7_9HYPH|nr:hypothetical protein [Lichenifustis flavocetrariae]MCW6509739.1 hypothetical protein [Lichenifustis flavocetrariae]